MGYLDKWLSFPVRVGETDKYSQGDRYWLRRGWTEGTHKIDRKRIGGGCRCSVRYIESTHHPLGGNVFGQHSYRVKKFGGQFVVFYGDAEFLL